MSTIDVSDLQPNMIGALLGRGHANAKPRHQLAVDLGISDRAARKLIEEARAEGLLICNDQDSKGYYIAETQEELKRQYWQDTARALSILKRRAPLREALKKAGVL